MPWAVDLYETADENVPVKEFLAALPPRLKAKALWEIDLLSEYGTDLKEPYVKAIKGGRYRGLFELRIKQSAGLARIFYFMKTDDGIVLLSGFLKKTKKTPKRELETALRYMKDCLSGASK